MRLVTCGLLLSLTLGVPLLSAACGGTTSGVGGNGDSGTHDGGGKGPDAMPTSHPDGGGKHDAGPPKDAGHEAAPIDTNYPANHPPMPTVVDFGGPTLANPVFIPITFPSDPNQSDIVAFTAGIGATSYWSTIVSQYGVGAATSGTPVVLTVAEEPAGTGGTIADSDIQTWLQTQIASGPLMGTNTADTVYAIFFPAGTTITLPQGGGAPAKSCVSFGGYHSNFTTTDTSTNVSYAVLPRCGSFPTASGTLSGVDAITGPASHEFVEAVSDPQPSTNMGANAAYASPDNNDFVWQFVVGGGEIGDMCAQFPGAFYKPSDFAYTVQRSWSNSAALASHDPCQPELPGEVFFNSIAVLTPTNLPGLGMTDAVSIPLHTSKTVEVDLYSDAATAGAWTVQAIDAQTLQGGPAALSFAWDKTTGLNGDKLHLTITANSTTSFGADAFILVSTLGTQSTLWIGLVSIQ